jgi:hypothetical protein
MPAVRLVEVPGTMAFPQVARLVDHPHVLAG